LNSFQEPYNLLKETLIEVGGGCDALRTSVRVQKLLNKTLGVSNYLNDGRSDGFNIDTLPKLVTVKGAEGTLLDFIVKEVEKDSPGELRKMFGGGSEFEAVKAARRHNLIEKRSELGSLIKKASDLLKEVFEASHPGSCLKARSEQLEARTADLQQLVEQFDDLEKKYADLYAWFGMPANKLQKNPSNEFFGVWDNFGSDIKKALDAMERKERQLQGARSRSVTPVRGNVSPRNASPRNGDSSPRFVRGNVSPRFARRASAPVITPINPHGERHDQPGTPRRASRFLVPPDEPGEFNQERSSF